MSNTTSASKPPQAATGETPEPFIVHAYHQAYAMATEGQRRSLRAKYEQYKPTISIDDVTRLEAMMAREDQATAAANARRIDE